MSQLKKVRRKVNPGTLTFARLHLLTGHMLDKLLCFYADFKKNASSIISSQNRLFYFTDVQEHQDARLHIDKGSHYVER